MGMKKTVRVNYEVGPFDKYLTIDTDADEAYVRVDNVNRPCTVRNASDRPVFVESFILTPGCELKINKYFTRKKLHLKALDKNSAACSLGSEIGAQYKRSKLTTILERVNCVKCLKKIGEKNEKTIS